MMRIKITNCAGWRVADLAELAIQFGALEAGYNHREEAFSALFGEETLARGFQKAVLPRPWVRSQ